MPSTMEKLEKRVVRLEEDGRAYEHTIGEIRDRAERIEKLQKEHNRVLDKHNKTLNRMQKVQAEHSKKLAEHDQRFDQVDRKLEEVDRKLEEVDCKVDLILERLPAA